MAKRLKKEYAQLLDDAEKFPLELRIACRLFRIEQISSAEFHAMAKSRMAEPITKAVYDHMRDLERNGIPKRLIGFAAVFQL